MSIDTLSVITIIGVAIAMIVDGQAAIAISAVAAGVSLMPVAAYVAGQNAALAFLASALATVVTTLVTFRVASLLPASVAPSPTTPMFSQADALFGPRSVRVAAAALALPCASWLSFNVALSGVAAQTGILLPAAYTWLCGVGRLLVSRSIEDLAVGVTLIALGLAATWATRGGSDLGAELFVLLSVGPFAGALTGWLGGLQRARSGT